MAVPVHVGDVGVIIRLTVYEDGAAKNIAAASPKEIKIRKPDGTILTKTGSFYTDGTDGKLQCTSEEDDFDIAGAYEARAYYTLGGWTGHTTKAIIGCETVT